MIFKDIFNKKSKIIHAELNKLMVLAFKNQHHKGDLLLLHINGHFREDLLTEEENEQKLNPHVVGPGSSGHSEYTHYQFINKYRATNISEYTYKDYLSEIKWSPDKRQRIEDLSEKEIHSIQLEMLIYLKFWEADLIIKKLYQLVRLIHGEPYDWYFKVQESSRDTESTGARQDIIRLKIREKLRKHSPVLYNVIKDTYKTQIRNSIAHSNYYFLNREIHLNNFIKEDKHSQLHSVSFDNWISIIHNTLVLYNEFINMNNVINQFYSEEAKKRDGCIPIQVTDKAGKQILVPVQYNDDWNDWSYPQQ